MSMETMPDGIKEKVDTVAFIFNTCFCVCNFSSKGILKPAFPFNNSLGAVILQ